MNGWVVFLIVLLLIVGAGEVVYSAWLRKIDKRDAEFLSHYHEMRRRK